MRFLLNCVTGTLMCFFFSCPGQPPQNPCYEVFQTLPGYPLYSPSKCDGTFLLIDEGYPDPFPTTWRWKPVRYFQYILSRQALYCESGDFIECGVATGKSADIFASVLDRWDTNGRALYGFDSFFGFKSSSQVDHDIRTGRHYFPSNDSKYSDKSSNEKNKNQIATNLSPHPCQIILVAGWIPDCFSGYEDKFFCFAHIDVDLYQATHDSLSFIYPRMVSGGIILFDDYGYPNCPGAKKAVDDYLIDKPEILISLPTGQAFLIKR